ncbi:MAG TPA: hypothetical protein VNA19_08905 [Pyrinomonadaceae bacterium]|jgi:hypothetical protein|nr:hypothetical protein [Pyrinomonadaceae bacterium]
MKERLTKIIIACSALVLVVMFACVALLTGTRAVAGAVDMQDDLLLVALAVCGAAASVVKNLRRRNVATCEQTALHIASSHRRTGDGTFMSLSSST